MITYKEIGHFGRLGNQMFQFASSYGIAKKLNYDVAFPVENTQDVKKEYFSDGISRECIFDIPKVFKLNESILKPKDYILPKIKYNFSETDFHYNENYLQIPDESNLNGYYQSEKYFKHVSKEVKELFSFKDEIKDLSVKLFPKVDSETVSIHIRRTDYVNISEFHPPCSLNYYSNALLNFTDKNYYFIIFSDDIEYCKKIFVENENVLYIDNKDPYIDLCLMSMCDHNIIANSSFSWWAAWLNDNPNKKVVAPKKWFGPAYNHYKTDDLYCNDWIIVDDFLKKEIVISLYDKNIDWVSNINSDVKVTIYRKGNITSNKNEIVLMPNVGRDVHTFFRHLYVNYENLSDITFFSQDYPFDHWEDIVDVINNDTFSETCQLQIGGYYGFHYNTIKYPSEKGGVMWDLYPTQHHGNGNILFCSSNGYPQDSNNAIDVNKYWKLIFSDDYPFIKDSRYEFIPGGHFAITKTHAQMRSKNFYKKIVQLLEKYEEAPWIIERLECYIFNPKYKSIL